MPDQIQNSNPLPPEEQFRQPGAFEHGKKNWFALHHIVAYVLLGVLGLAIIAGAYYYQVSRMMPNTTVAPVHHEKANSTADWKTYTNSDYGFELKYPANLILEDFSQYNNQNYEFLFGARSTKLPQEFGGAVPDGQVNGKDFVTKGYSFFIHAEPKKIMAIDLTKSVPGEYSSTPLKVAGTTAYQVIDEGGLSNGPEVVISNPAVPDKYIIFNYDWRCDNVVCKDSEVDKLGMDILSTFKFIKTGAFPIEISSNSVFIKWFEQKQKSYGSDMSSFSKTAAAIKSITEPKTTCPIQTQADKSLPSPDGKLIVCIQAGAEPDSDLYLINKTSNSSQRLEYCGTPCTYEDGFWLDNSRFVFLETDLDMDYTDNRFDIYNFKIIEFDFANNAKTTWRSDLRIQR